MLDLSTMTMTPLSTTNNTESPSEDLYALLESKEQDLYLAAELGKALLEKNEHLARQSERMVDEYQQKIDVLEQEKHALRRKLTSVESEAEMKVAELLQDLQQIRNANEQREKTVKQAEREKTEMVAKLEAHSLRLTQQLEQSSKVEEELTFQLQQLKDQCNVSKSSLQDHVTSFEMLNHEMTLLSERKTELEKRAQRLKEERDELAVNYQEATDRISALEHTLREQNVQVLHTSHEVESLRSSNIDLEERLQRLNNALNNSSGRRSLRLEIEGIENEDEEAQFKREILDAYNQLRSICDRLKVTRFYGNSLNSEDASLSVEEIQYHQVQVGLLSSIVTELTSLLTEALSLDDNSAAFSASHTREALERSQRALASAEERAEQMQEEIGSLQSQLLLKQAELGAASEDRDRARADLAPGTFQDQLAEARRIRDQAVARRNEAEIALAAARLETVQASSQLMEAIRQKVELSEQLEQWQMDMQSLLDEQMRHKLTKQERARKMLIDQQEQRHQQQNGSSLGNNPGKRLFSLFSR